MVSRRLTPETLAQMRALYETGQYSQKTIALQCKVNIKTLCRHARAQGWTRPEHPDARSAIARPIKKIHEHRPIERHALLMRLYAGLEAQIEEYERRLLDESTAERDIKHLVGLAATLERLSGIEKALGAHIHAQEGNTSSIDELRTRLAERLARLHSDEDMHSNKDSASKAD